MTARWCFPGRWFSIFVAAALAPALACPGPRRAAGQDAPSPRAAPPAVIPPGLPPRLPPPPHPADNPPSPEKIELGRKLFFDPSLSRDGRIACASCHDGERGFGGREAISPGVEGRRGARHAPTLVNAAYNKFQFWDGRAGSLEEQALGPIQNPVEMDTPLPALEAKLNAAEAYRREFGRVFGGPPTARRAAQALAAYQRTILSKDTPFDRHLAGERDALSPAAARGMTLFFGQANCAACHSGPNFTDNDFHNVGVLASAGPRDEGRRAVTGREADDGAFKTPTLREIGRSAPYMHDGQFATLRDVLRHYNFGGVTDADNPRRDRRLEVLYLGEDELDDLESFLREGLTTPRRD